MTLHGFARGAQEQTQQTNHFACEIKVLPETRTPENNNKLQQTKSDQKSDFFDLDFDKK